MMDRRTWIRRLSLVGAALGLGATQAGILSFRYFRKRSLELSQLQEQEAETLPPRGPFRLPSAAQSTAAGRDEDICSVSFSLLGNRLVSGSADNNLSLWEAATEKCTYTWSGPPHGGFAGIALCSDNSWLATISPTRGVKFWTPGKTRGTGETTFKEVTYNEFRFHPTCVAFKRSMEDSASKSPSLVAVALNDHSIRILEYDPNRRALPGNVLALRTNDPRAVKVPDLFSEVAVLKGHTDQINAVSFSSDGKCLASAASDNTIRIWDANTWQQSAILRGHTGSVNSVSFSSDGERLASASADHSIVVWNTRTRAQEAVLHGHGDSVLNAVFCEDSRWLASTSVDRKILVWPLYSGFEKSFQLAINPGNYAAIASSADGRYFASAWGRTVKFWKISEIESKAKSALRIA